MSLIVAVSSLSGGQGKSTTSLLLALELAARGRSVLVVDLDPQGDLSAWLEADPLQPGSLELLLKKGEATECIQETATENLSVIGAGDRLDSAQLYLSGRTAPALVLRQRLAPVVEDYDYLILDTPPARSLLGVTALGAAQQVVISAEASGKGIASLDRTRELLTEMQDDEATEAQLVAVIPFRLKVIGRNIVGKCAAALEVFQEELGELLLPALLESEQIAAAATNVHRLEGALAEPIVTLADRLENHP